MAARVLDRTGTLNRVLGRKRARRQVAAMPVTVATGDDGLDAVFEDTMRRFPKTMARLAE